MSNAMTSKQWKEALRVFWLQLEDEKHQQRQDEEERAVGVLQRLFWQTRSFRREAEYWQWVVDEIAEREKWEQECDDEDDGWGTGVVETVVWSNPDGDDGSGSGEESDDGW